MNINLPGALELTCPSCQASFATAAKQLNAKTVVACPFCADTFGIYAGLSGRLKRKVYHAIRDELEHRVYYEKTKDLPPEVRDWSKLIPPADESSQS